MTLRRTNPGNSLIPVQAAPAEFQYLYNTHGSTCNKKFKEDCEHVRSHCHFTSSYRSAANVKRNLDYYVMIMWTMWTVLYSMCLYSVDYSLKQHLHRSPQNSRPALALAHRMDGW